MSKLFIQPFRKEDFDSYLEYASKNDLNLEITTFASSKILDGNWKELLNYYQGKLIDFNGAVSLHGPFMEMVIHSRDDRIAAVAKERLIHTLMIASELNAEFVVFHGNFNPLIKHDMYITNWIDKQSEFWNSILDKYKLTILIENLWEPNPEIFRRLLERIKFPNFKICFDTGHANIYSNGLVNEWFSVLSGYIPYIHINDNHGETDTESVPGDGNIDWQEFSEIIRTNKIEPNLILEVGSLDNSIRAIDYFKTNKFYPFE